MWIYILLICYYATVIWFEANVQSKTCKDAFINLFPFGLWIRIILEIIECLKQHQKRNIK